MAYRTGADLYFVHSYVAAPADPSTIVAETTHGSPFPSVVAAANVIGVQFHPERSGTDGLRVLANFAAIASAAASQRTGATRPADIAPTLVGRER